MGRVQCWIYFHLVYKFTGRAYLTAQCWLALRPHYKYKQFSGKHSNKWFHYFLYLNVRKYKVYWFISHMRWNVINSLHFLTWLLSFSLVHSFIFSEPLKLTDYYYFYFITRSYHSINFIYIRNKSKRSITFHVLFSMGIIISGYWQTCVNFLSV